MFSNNKGSIPLFRAFGIPVYLHVSWFLLLPLEFSGGATAGRYHSPVWNIAELLALFAIVLVHEFGHALACKSVGGRADRIVLWPLGGVAFVQPPARPGAMLWSIVAGPLVNVILLPITIIPAVYLAHSGAWANIPDVAEFAKWVAIINGVLLVFNILPIYPLDGGQILQALLWFVIGRSRSLAVTAVVGLAVGVAGGLAALYFQDIWLVIMAAFIVWRAWVGFRAARYLAALERQGIPTTEQY